MDCKYVHVLQPVSRFAFFAIRTICMCSLFCIFA